MPVVERIEAVNFHPAFKDRLVQRVRHVAQEIRSAEREISNCYRRLGVSGDAGAALLRKLARDRRGLLAVKRKCGLSEESLQSIKKIAAEARAKIRRIESEEEKMTCLMRGVSLPSRPTKPSGRMAPSLRFAR